MKERANTKQKQFSNNNNNMHRTPNNIRTSPDPGELLATTSSITMQGCIQTECRNAGKEK
jgi:hypothetical protein